MTEREQLAEEREGLLEQVEQTLETPLILLGFVWLALLIVDLVWGLNPWLAGFMTVIWIIFILEFALRLALAPNKPRFFRRNWLTAVSLVLPALRALRALAVVRLALRGARLVSIVGSLNRGMSALTEEHGPPRARLRGRGRRHWSRWWARLACTHLSDRVQFLSAWRATGRRCGGRP